jgi:competence CoiA-like predicted nuclease
MNAPGKKPRGKCPVCSKEVALRKGGIVREHFQYARGRVKCVGGGNLATK